MAASPKRSRHFYVTDLLITDYKSKNNLFDQSLSTLCYNYNKSTMT